MSILDGGHETYSADFGRVRVSDLYPSDRIRLTVEARCAALDAATRLIASGGKWQHRVPIELAGALEAWILRPDDTQPDDPP